MSKILSKVKRDTKSAVIRAVEFEAAVRAIAERIGTRHVNCAGTPISIFKVRYATVLKRAKAGSIEVLTRGRERFIVLGREQVIALGNQASRGRLVAEVFAGLPTVPAWKPRLRSTSVRTKDPYRVPR